MVQFSEMSGPYIDSQRCLSKYAVTDCMSRRKQNAWNPGEELGTLELRVKERVGQTGQMAGK